MSSQLLVFTTGNDLDLLQQSANSVMITISEYHVPWSDYVQVKLRGGINHILNTVYTRPKPYVMWVDGHDSLILKPEDEILARLDALGNPVLIAAEANCWPDAELAGKYPESPSPRFLNAGGFIGPIERVMTAMHTALSYADSGDDQRAWTKAYLDKALPEVQIDHARRIFACASDGDAALKADTCCLHWNGKLPGRGEYWNECQSKHR